MAGYNAPGGAYDVNAGRLCRCPMWLQVNATQYHNCDGCPDRQQPGPKKSPDKKDVAGDRAGADVIFSVHVDPLKK